MSETTEELPVLIGGRPQLPIKNRRKNSKNTRKVLPQTNNCRRDVTEPKAEVILGLGEDTIWGQTDSSEISHFNNEKEIKNEDKINTSSPKKVPHNSSVSKRGKVSTKKAINKVPPKTPPETSTGEVISETFNDNISEGNSSGDVGEDPSEKYILAALTTIDDFPCSECGKVFNNSKSLIRHMRLHSGRIQSYKCELCDYLFYTNAHLMRHIRSHTKEKPFKCNDCDRAFSDTSNLTAHQRAYHLGVPNQNVCKECGKTFSKPSSLNRHMRLHSGEEGRYPCDVCGRRFSQAYNLTVHKRRHTGEKPYYCEVCNMMFSDLSNLSSHRRVHTGLRPFLCEDCGRSFAHSSELTTHRRTHTGERPYPCTECDKAFTQRCNLVAHLRTHDKHNIYAQMSEPMHTSMLNIYSGMYEESENNGEPTDEHESKHSDTLPFNSANGDVSDNIDEENDDLEADICEVSINTDIIITP